MTREYTEETKELLKKIEATGPIKRQLKDTLNNRVLFSNRDTYPFRSSRRKFGDNVWSDSCTVEEILDIADAEKPVPTNVMLTYIQSILERADKKGNYVLLQVDDMVKNADGTAVVVETFQQRIEQVNRWMVVVNIEPGDWVLYVFFRNRGGQIEVDIYDPVMAPMDDAKERKRRSEVQHKASKMILLKLRQTEGKWAMNMVECRRLQSRFEGPLLLCFYAKCIIMGNRIDCWGLTFEMKAWRVEVMNELLILRREKRTSTSYLSLQLDDMESSYNSKIAEVHLGLIHWIEKEFEEEETKIPAVETSTDLIPSVGPSQVTAAGTARAEAAEDTPSPPKKKSKKTSLLKQATQWFSEKVSPDKARGSTDHGSVDLTKLADDVAIPTVTCNRCLMELKGLGLINSHLIDAGCIRTPTCPKANVPFSKYHLDILQALCYMNGDERIVRRDDQAPVYDDDVAIVSNEALGITSAGNKEFIHRIQQEREHERYKRRDGTRSTYSSAKNIALVIDDKAEYFSKHIPPIRRFHYPPSWEYPVITWTDITESKWCNRIASTKKRGEQRARFNHLKDIINQWVADRIRPQPQDGGGNGSEDSSNCSNADSDEEEKDDKPSGGASGQGLGPSDLFGSDSDSAKDDDDNAPDSEKGQTQSVGGSQLFSLKSNPLEKAPPSLTNLMVAAALEKEVRHRAIAEAKAVIGPHQSESDSSDSDNSSSPPVLENEDLMEECFEVIGKTRYQWGEAEIVQAAQDGAVPIKAERLKEILYNNAKADECTYDFVQSEAKKGGKPALLKLVCGDEAHPICISSEEELGGDEQL